MMDVSVLTPHQKLSHRQELAEMWDRAQLHDLGLSAAVSKQVIEAAITGLDALERIENLARQYEGYGTPIGVAVAAEIRATVDWRTSG